MCLYTKQKEPLGAKEPIKAFKVLIHTSEDRFLSPFKGFDYTEYVNSHCIVKGTIPKVEHPADNIVVYCFDLGVVNRGLHLFISEDKATELAMVLNNGVVLECNIPVGSRYFLSEGETEICTNQFRFIKDRYK